MMPEKSQTKSWLLWLLILMTMRKSHATTAKIIKVSKASGESVVLPSDLLMEMLETGADVRWSSPNMLLRNKISTCQHGRCELTVNKSLNFSRVQVEDSGNYTLEVFDKHGNIEEKKVFVLQVEEPSSHGGPSLQLLFLLLPIIVFFLMMMMMIMRRRRRRRRKRTVQISGQTEENVYMPMHAHHGNEGKQEKEQEKESFHEVPQHPAAPEELVEDIYV